MQDTSRIVFFTGAGISTVSGLSDFRSKGGMWDSYHTVTFVESLSSHVNRIEYWSMRRKLIPVLLAARPNLAHHCLARMEKERKSSYVISQNFDGLR